MNDKTQTQDRTAVKAGSPRYSPERESRVAAALRENLRKRKAQMQQRTIAQLNDSFTPSDQGKE